MTTTSARTRRPTSWLPLQLVLAVVLLAVGANGLQDNYLEPRQVLTDGTPGTFTLRECERVSGTRSGSDTSCTGTFRSDDGSVVVRDHELDHDHDAEGVKQGESFAARALVDEYGPTRVVRADDTGRTNLTLRGVGWGGIILLGCTMAGFAARGRMAPGPARSRLGTALGIVAGVSGLAWIVGLTMGSGFLT